MNSSNFAAVSSNSATEVEVRRTGPRQLVRHARETVHPVMRRRPASQATTALPPAPDSGYSAIFRCDGEFWTLSYDQKTVCLRDIKGFTYIARLLSQPDTEFHAIELAREAEVTGVPGDAAMQTAEFENIGVHFGDLGDAGEMLDNQAKAAYRRRLSELRDEQAEAKALGQIDRAEAAENEIEALIAELSRATGLGGRNRTAASSSERARQSVTRAIKNALGRIADHHSALAQMLTRQIKTGTYCSYQPDPNCIVHWALAATDADEASPPPDQQAAEVALGPVAEERDRRLPLAEVVSLILDASRNAPETMEVERGAAHVTPILQRSFVRLAQQLQSTESKAPIGNIIVLAIDSAPLLESLNSSIKHFRGKSSNA